MTGQPQVRQVDLADLNSVRRFADTLREDIDVLVNNGGIMGVPRPGALAAKVDSVVLLVIETVSFQRR